MNIKQIIRDQMQLHKHSARYIADQIDEKHNTFTVWLNKGNGLRIAEKCMKFYNLSIVKIIGENVYINEE